jgi:signal transduction histidine kinase
MLMVSRRAASAWTEDEVALADALGGQAAVAIENARLYRQVQESLRKLQEAQYGMMRAERLAAIGTLASSLAHEVRNPLNSISLQLVLLARRIAKLEESKREELSQVVETTRREIQRLNDLVEEFLSMSSLDRLSLSEADPREVVREVTELMRPVAKQRGVAMRSSPGPKASPIRMDREKIRQVLINLIRNAIDAMPDGGTLTLTLERSDDAVAIRVADTGIGIQPGTDVFDFFTTTKRGGTGLGLPISRRIVEAHGGSLGYKSAPGRGTVFSVTLKTAKSEALTGGAARR